MECLIPAILAEYTSILKIPYWEVGGPCPFCCLILSLHSNYVYQVSMCLPTYFAHFKYETAQKQDKYSGEIWFSLIGHILRSTNKKESEIDGHG